MAIGGPNGNNLFNLNNLFKNAGVASKNQPEQVSSTEETSVDTANKSSGRIAQLRAETLGDVFGKVGAPELEKTAGASPIASTAIKFNETSGITATSALGEPSSVTAIKDPVFSEIAAGGNTIIASENNSLLRAARLSQAAGLDGDFQVSAEIANLKKDNEILALVGNLA